MGKIQEVQERKLRIAFVHPDLGIGGAERLVVDAAVALQRRGHDVVMFTSRHDPQRCFEETRNGTLQVHVLGSSLPRSLHPKVPLTILFSILRSLLLSILIILSLYFPPPASFINPLAPLKHFDVFIVDQQSVCVPLLRWVAGSRVVFYCHFPDKLLSGGWQFGVDDNDGRGVGKVKRKSASQGGVGILKRIYRWPIDKLEEVTTGQADTVLSNSRFTSQIYARAFPSLAKRAPRVVYPCIDISAYEQSGAGSSKKGKGKAKATDDDGVELIKSDRPTFISLNRFEEKKNAALAIKAFAKLGTHSLIDEGRFSDLRLVIGGGYDASLPDNVETLASLQDLCSTLDLSYHTIESLESPTPPSFTQVLFILNFTTSQRTFLLLSENTIALLYTPSNEHFGIVPLEAGGCGLPVLAVNSGGPTETVVDLQISTSPEGERAFGNEEGTGILLPPSPVEWSEAMAILISLPKNLRDRVSRNAKRRIREMFSSETLGRELEDVCQEVVGFGDVHVDLGDRLIWWGGRMMLFSVLGMGAILGIGIMRA